MWIFELTNDICITYCDIYLPRSCLFSLFGHLIWLWISKLPKKHLIYYCGHLIWKPIKTKIPIVNKLDLVTFSVVNLNTDIIKCTGNRGKRSLDTIHHYELGEAHQQEKQIV